MQVTSARLAIVRFWIIALAVALLAMVTILSARADDPPAESEQTPAAEQSAAEAAPAANAETAKPPKFDVEVYPLPTKREQLILDALQQPLKLDFHELPLNDVVAYLSDLFRNDFDIQIDRTALEDNGLGPETPITLKTGNMSLKSALGILRDQYDIGYVIKDEYLLFTSLDKADVEVKTRIYPVADLIGEDYDSLIEVITATVKPQSWDEVGGPGSITPLAATGCLVFSQTQDVHDETLALLRALRAAKRDAAGEE